MRPPGNRLMAKPNYIELSRELCIPILYEDRSVLAIDKPGGWMLAPNTWDRTGRNLQLALESSVREGEYWARSRNLKFLRFLHRLDADTSGVLLLAKNVGVVRAYSEMFESHDVEKVYWAVVQGAPKPPEWTCELPLAPHPDKSGLMVISPREGKPAETHFRMLRAVRDRSLVEVHPITGRTHQIRIHLAAAGFAVLNDPWYQSVPSPETAGRSAGHLKVEGHKSFHYKDAPPMALRAIRVAYQDPFQRRRVRIEAPVEAFLKAFGFA